MFIPFKENKNGVIINYRSGNDGLNAAMSVLTGLHCEDPTLTQQQFRLDCDLNVIMKRVYAGQELTHFHDAAASYGDFTNIPDFHTSLNIVKAGEATFNALPAELRKRFGNDPESFVNFATNPANRDELRSMGLLKPDSAEAGPILPPQGKKSASEAGGEGDTPHPSTSSKHSVKPSTGD